MQVLLAATDIILEYSFFRKQSETLTGERHTTPRSRLLVARDRSVPLFSFLSLPPFPLIPNTSI